MAEVMSRSWPGNLHELRSYAMSFALGADGTGKAMRLSLPEQVDAFEKLVLIQTLKRTAGRAVDAAHALGIPRNTLYDRLARHGLSPRDFRVR